MSSEGKGPRHGRLWMAVRLAEVRLRFVAIMVVTGLIVANWESIQNHLDRWTRPAPKVGTAAAAVEYYCPMDPQVLREEPGNCPVCGMPLSQRAKGAKPALPEGVVSRVSLSPSRIVLAGVGTSAVGYEKLAREVRAAGTVEMDERRMVHVSARVAGRLEDVRANVPGLSVKAGEVLASLYSPDLVNAQEEFLAGGGADARERLLRWGMAPEDLAELEKTRHVQIEVPVRAPRAGIVWRGEMVHSGHHASAGEDLFALVDHDRVWVVARIFEGDLGDLRLGQEMEIKGRAFPDRSLKGRVSLIDPHVDLQTRTVEVRAEMENADHLLKPGMYVDAILHDAVHGLNPEEGDKSRVLAVPESAVIDTGTRQLVYVESVPGTYDAVEAVLGPRAGAFYPVYLGLKAGDRVVTAGAFLVDAETRLNPSASAAYFGASGKDVKP